MVALLPLEVLQTVGRQYPCREAQIETIATFYNGTFPPPRTLVAYGLEQTNKLEIIQAILKARSLKHVIIKCRECLSQRHLLPKIFASCLRALDPEGGAEQYDRVDSINALAVSLEKLFRKRGERITVVLDAIDKQRGAGATLLPALARLGNLVPNISIIMTSSSPRPLQLHKTGVPYVHFPPCSRAEAVYIVTQDNPTLPENVSDIKLDDLKKTYVQFAITVYDSIVAATSSTSIAAFRGLCEKLWPRFIWPAISGELPPGKSKTVTWDFARLLIRNRALFQAGAEVALIERLQPAADAQTFEQLQKLSEQQAREDTSALSSSAPAPNTPSKYPVKVSENRSSSSKVPALLKHFPAILLLSSYLASHTLHKNDIILFSRLSSSTKRIRKHRTPKSIFKSPSKTPTKATATIDGAGDSAPGTPSGSTGMTKNMLGRTRTLFDLKFGAPKAFSLERVVAILRAVHPDGFKHTRSISDRVYREMGELERLRLVERVSDEDEVEGGGRWKIGVGREVVEVMLVSWGIKGGIGEWELQGEE